MTDQLGVKDLEGRQGGVPEASVKFRTKTYASFEDLPVSYLDLFENNPTRSFDLSLPWFQNLCRNSLDRDSRVRIYGLEVDDLRRTAVAALPTRHQRHTRWLKPATVFGLSNYYSSFFGPSLHPDYPSGQLLQGLAKAICSDTPQWDAVNLRPFTVDSADFECLVKSFRQCGWRTQTYFCFGNWYLPLNGRSFKEYFANRPAVLQNTVRRKSKKLERSGQARYELVTGNDDRLDRAIHDYTKVYNESWKVPEPHPEFVPGLIKTCARMGWLRLGLVYIGDAPAAAQLWIVKDGVASIYKLAYDEKFAALSVGSYLTARLMEHVIDVDRVSEVDYLTGDDPYKKDWMSHRRERWGILALNPHTAMGNLAIIGHVGGRALKGAVRSFFRMLRH